jgi:hypothetical protein
LSYRWMLRGTQFTNCNCDWGCPCQFGSPTTHGHCEALVAGHIEEGYFNETRLDGLQWALLVQWPGEIVAGNGTEQAIIDERASTEQREALRKILSGEATRPGSTHFHVFASTMSTMREPVFAPIQLAIDIEARKADVTIPDLVESKGSPIISAFTGESVRYGIHLPKGFEFTYAEVGQGVTKSSASIKLDLRQTHGHFNVLHMNQDGVIRPNAAAVGH